MSCVCETEEVPLTLVLVLVRVTVALPLGHEVRVAPESKKCYFLIWKIIVPVSILKIFPQYHWEGVNGRLFSQ